MGCGNSKVSGSRGKTRGYVPYRYQKSDAKWEPTTTQWIVGNGTLLKFDITTLTMSNVKLPEGTIIGDRCATVYLPHDEEAKSSFIVCGGNNDFKQFYDNCYMFTVGDPENPKPMVSLPLPLSHHCLIQDFKKNVYCIGGMTTKKSNDQDNYPGTLCTDIYMLSEDQTQWVNKGTLPKPRMNFEVVVNGTSIFIFAGESGGGKGPSTQIDIYHTDTGKVNSAEYRLPLGVTGASLQFFGDDLLLVGGERCGRPSTAVMKLDFQDKTILSVRDLKKPRANTILLPIAFDELLAIGGSTERTCERRVWDESENDYNWFDCTTNVKGLECMGNPNEYNAVTITFEVTGADDDNFPDLQPSSNFIFGNELSPFLLEFTDDMEFAYFPAPMRLQQKTGQVAYRANHNTIIFIGGTDTTYTYYSRKTYRFDIPNKKVERMANLNVGRTGFAFCEHNGTLYVTGGWTTNQQYLNSGESISIGTLDKWNPLPNMTCARSGHFMWADDKNGRIYAAGGISQVNGQPLNTIEWLDVNNPTKWTLHEQQLPTALQGAMIMEHTDGEHCLVIGGATGSDPYTTGTKEIRQISRSNFNGFEQTLATMKCARYNPFAILGGHDDLIVVLGGTTDKMVDIFNHKTFELYDSEKISKINQTIYDSLENYTTDLGLYTCAGC